MLKGTSKLETKIISRRKEQSSLAKQGKNAMMPSISPRKEQSSSKARNRFKTVYDECMTSLRTDGLSSGFGHAGLMHSDTNFTPSPRQENRRNAISHSPSRPMSGGITMETCSTIDRLVVSMGTHKGGASSSTRLQPQLTSSTLGSTPMLGTVSDATGIIASAMTGLEELRQDVTERFERVEERAQQGHQRLRDELAGANLQARSDKAELIRNID